MASISNSSTFARPLASGLVSILLLFLSGSARADAPRWFVAPVVDKAPDIELGLADPAWEKALKPPFAKLEDGPGDTTKYPIESYWLRAGSSLFVAFKCINPSSPNLWAAPNQLRDSNVYTKECIELITQYVQFGRRIKGLEQEIVLNVIFGGHEDAR